MKNLVQKFFALLMCSVFCFAVNAQTTVLQEDFSLVTDSTNSDVSNNLNSITAVPGWTGNKIYKSTGKIKLGSSSVPGWIQTPAIDLSANGGNFTVSFDAEAWYHDSTSISVFVNGTEYVVSGLDNDGSYGSYNHFSFTATGGTASTHIKFMGKDSVSKTRFFLDNIVIEQNGSTPIAAIPTFSVASGVYSSPFSLTLSTATENASIYYTLDGTTPNDNSTLYVSPIPINQNTTVKAIAYANGYNHSAVATANYSFPAQVANIAAFKALNSVSSTPYQIANDVTFVFKNGVYTYVKDASAALLIYGSGITTSYEEGDQISGLTGTYSLYSNQIEMSPSFNTAPATSNTGAVEPMIVSISDIVNNYAQYDAQLVTLQNVTLDSELDFEVGSTGTSISISQGNDYLMIYNRFKTLDTIMAVNTVTDVTGFVAIYGSTIQIYPRDNSDLVAAVPQPSIAIVSPADGSAFSTLDTLDIDIEIDNFTLGTDGLLKIECPMLVAAGMTNPSFFDAATLAYFTSQTITPLPVGTYTATASLVGLDHSPLANPVSAVTTFTVTAPQLPVPTITPIAGMYADSVEVSIACTTQGAEIRYTIDGTEPTATSTLYTTPFTLSSTATVKAKAFLANWDVSETASATYTIVHESALAVSPTELQFSSTNTTAAFYVTAAFLTEPVVITCNNAHFTLSQTSIAVATTSAMVTVTFDATEPAEGVVTLTSGDLSTQVTLTATATLPAPVFTPVSGSTDTAITVSMNCDVTAANIYYTMDGSTPTDASALYTAPIELNVPGTYTIKAVAMRNDWENSTVATAIYTVTAPIPPVPDYNDTLAYATGFERAEGYTMGSQYNNVTEIVNGPANYEWATVYGTVSTTAAISDSASMQMRWYTSSQTSLGYARTTFDITHATRITFQGKSTNGLNALVSYSTDGGNTYVDSLFEMSSNARSYTWVISENAEFDNVRFKFSVVLPETAPGSTSRLIIDSVCIYNFPSMISGTVAMPVISPNGGTLYEPTDVTITTTTNGAQIYYTTDGTTPDENSTLYVAPFTISANTTVKAIAMSAGYNPSSIATATYNFPVEVANIAAFKAANTATNTNVYKIAGDVTFVFANSRNIYVQDATGGLLLYDQNNVFGTGYVEGDVISGGICGTYTLYNGLVEMVPVRQAAASVSNTGTVSPVITDVPSIISNYDEFESRLVKLQQVTFVEGGTFALDVAYNMDIEQNDEIMQCRSVFKNLDMTIAAGQVADVTGFVLRYNTNYQIAPRSNDDIAFVQQGTVDMPVIEVNPLTNALYSVEITCATEDASIYYTTDGTTPDEQSEIYESSFIIAGGVTIKAIAMKNGMASSDVAVYANVGVDDIVANSITVAPNPTNGIVVIRTNDLKVKSVELYNVEGQLLRSESTTCGATTLNLSADASGLYFVRIVGDDFSVVKKINRK